MPGELWPKAAGAFMKSGKHKKSHKEGKRTPERERGKGGWKKEENNLVPLLLNSLLKENMFSREHVS